MSNATLAVDEITVSIENLLKPRILVCVAGSYSDGSEHCLSVEVAREVIRSSETNALVINIPRKRRPGLDVREILHAFVNLPQVVPLMNTSRASCAQEAKEMIEIGGTAFADMSGECFNNAPLFKLEILSKDLNALDDEVLRCLSELDPDVRRRTLPIFSPVPEVVKAGIGLGCPAVRILCGRIGQQTGILDPVGVAAAIRQAGEIPVILEGGLATVADILESARLRASGVLINSAFRYASDPVALAVELRAAALNAWHGVTA